MDSFDEPFNERPSSVFEEDDNVVTFESDEDSFKGQSEWLRQREEELRYTNVF